MSLQSVSRHTQAARNTKGTSNALRKSTYASQSELILAGQERGAGNQGCKGVRRRHGGCAGRVREAAGGCRAQGVRPGEGEGRPAPRL